jgi:diguanylate cyclase (GGDEF)-like protein
MRDLAAARVLELVNRVDRAATRIVADWLNDTGAGNAGSPQMIADLATLVGRVPPSEVVNAHLMWRGASVEVLQEQIDRGGTERSIIEQARLVLTDRCDAALVAVSRQFDEPRDRVTGLANRSLLLERLAHALQSAERYKDSVAVIFIEVELTGEAEDVVVEAADRLRRVSRSSDTVARLGAGEFVIVCERLRSELEAVAIADRARLALSQPYVVDGEHVYLSVSEGIAVSSGGDGPETLLADASAARRAVPHH